MNTPNVILNIEQMDGVGRGTSPLVVHSHGRYPEYRGAKVLLSQLHSLGFESVTCSYDGQMIEMLRSMDEVRHFQVYPEVLNLSRSSRDIQNFGMVGFAKKRIMSVKVLDLRILVLASLRHLPGVLKMDYGLLSMLLAELEFLRFRSLHPKVVFLHPSMSDIALANHNADYFRLFTTFFKGRHGVEPGIMSNNVGCLLQKLDEWNIEVRHIAGPINRRGYRMKPDKRTCEELIMKANKSVVATEVCCPEGPTEEDFDYLRELNISSCTVGLGSALSGFKILDLIGRQNHG